MPNRNHLRIIAARQLSETGIVKFNYGAPEAKSENRPEPNYFYMAKGFRDNLESYREDLELKIASKDETIDVPYDIDYVEVDFMGQFHLEKYYSIWYNTFGLEGVSFTKYNRTALFSISDREKFQVFINSVEGLINRGLENDETASFNKNIRFVKNFKLLTLSDVLKVNAESLGNVVVLKTIELPANQEVENSIIEALEFYLTDHILDYNIDRENNRLEIYDATLEELTAIAQNFDIIESITSSLSGVISPGQYNVPNRDFGFEVSNTDEELPLIGILDTGISMQTPLASITVQDDTFNLGGNPLIDEYGNHGHGTMVGALAALGRRNHLNNFQGEVNADAKLLSIKLLGNSNGYLSEKKVLEMLYDAKTKYPHLSIFVLTICYNTHKSTNEMFSNYTYELDKFAHKTDSLIFISTGNNDYALNENINYDLEYFTNEHTNLNTPADSMNNVTVGAAADGLYSGVFNGISSGKEFPTIYSRKDHVDLAAINSVKKRNKNLFKPDVLESGGDYGFYNPTTIDFMDNAAMTVLSSNPAMGYTKEVGTSLAAPLVANLAAQLKIAYPDLKSQTLKALIVNGATLKSIVYPDAHKTLLNRTSGYGLIDADQTIFSNENNATMVLEDSIKSEEQKIYPINFPDYLVSTPLGKNNGILKVTATLCFSFLPLQHNQLTYCPIHMAFSVYRNHTSEEINRVQKELNSKLRSNLTWSQSARDKATPAPYSNVQKLTFNVDVSLLRNEERTFKLAVQARLSNQIMASQVENYPKEFNFSLVLKIEETLKVNTGRLYDELRAINSVEVINVAEAEADLEGEV
ncbi:S8 family serine peptidase [Aurantibacter crassamenti]|uniref:S8 family serine peptidase n=1 Tax=Aurantibacter crassamenti TaxID=1837375 RepID=UPI00193A7A7A|nr:S8 family serine peptidase [Aurantibacter crassamenti]MBM1107187.1 S8 family serine peptidase [Aurantibacter crassamenti]